MADIRDIITDTKMKGTQYANVTKKNKEQTEMIEHSVKECTYQWTKLLNKMFRELIKADDRTEKRNIKQR